MVKKMKIGIALGSGGAKGLAHIGVMEILQKYGIQVDIIAGTSMGAIIGGLIALGYKPAELEVRANMQGAESKNELMKRSINSRALYSTEYIHSRLFKMYGDKIFSDLKIPFYALATDLIKGEKVVFNSGKLINAVEASSRIPLYYPPKKIGKMVLVDGAVTCPVPTGVLKGKCDFIISVPLPSYNKNIHPHHSLKMMNTLDRSIDILMDKLMKTELNCEQPNLVINMDGIEKYSTFDFDYAKEIIEIGRNSTEKVIKELLGKLNKMKFNKNNY